jgi:prophage regulatory protein
MPPIKPAYLDRATTANYVSLSESMIQKLMSRDQFPKPRQLSGQRVGWLVRELDEWVETRPVSQLLPVANSGRNQPTAASA